MLYNRVVVRIRLRAFDVELEVRAAELCSDLVGGSWTIFCICLFSFSCTTFTMLVSFVNLYSDLGYELFDIAGASYDVLVFIGNLYSNLGQLLHSFLGVAMASIIFHVLNLQAVLFVHGGPHHYRGGCS